MLFSRSSTYKIDSIDIPGFPGKLGLVCCPGYRRGERFTQRQAAKNAQRDLKELLRWKADGVVTLMEETELERLGLAHLPDLIEGAGMWWRYLPIHDMYAPDERFEKQWDIQGERLRNCLAQGQRIVIHCRAGLGRTGMIAARILVEMGMSPAAAIAHVRQTNKGRIQTRQQFYFIHEMQPLNPLRSDSTSDDLN